MKQPRDNWPAWALVVVFVILAVLSLTSCDRLVSSILEDIRTISLSSEATAGTEEMEIELSRLRQKATYLADDLAELGKRHLPSVADLRELQNSHRLKLVQMERMTSSGKDRSGQMEYAAVLNGTIGALTRFLADLEKDYIVKGNQVSLKTANSDGSAVNLSFTVVVREE